MIIEQGKKHYQLGMDSYFTNEVKVKVIMVKYVEIKDKLMMTWVLNPEFFYSLLCLYWIYSI